MQNGEQGPQPASFCFSQVEYSLPADHTFSGRLREEAPKFTGLALSQSSSLSSHSQRPFLTAHPKHPPSLLVVLPSPHHLASLDSMHICSWLLSSLLEGGGFGGSLLYSQHLESCLALSKSSSINKRSMNESFLDCHYITPIHVNGPNLKLNSTPVS